MPYRRVTGWSGLLAITLALSAAAACGGPGGEGAEGASSPTPGPSAEPSGEPSGTPSTWPTPSPTPTPSPLSWPRPCSDLHAQDAFPTFELTIAPQHWNALIQEFQTGVEEWHPATFRYGDEVVNDVMVRNRGNNSRCGEKMQFAISFNRVDPDQRFHGLRRIHLDHGSCKVLQERLALSFARDFGVPAACANHAQLRVNGSFYGLFTNLEAVNKDFLKRNFAENDGNLWKSGNQLETNEDDTDFETRLPEFWAADDLETVDELTDIDQAIREWAAEAMMPAVDNYWIHGWNYYLYEHPTRGFLFLPHDWDQAWPTSSTRDFDPLNPVRRRPANIVLADPEWRAKYLDALEEAWALYDPAIYEERVETWWEQVVDAAADDPFLTVAPDSNPPGHLMTHFGWRHAWIGEFLACQRGEGPCPLPEPTPTPAPSPTSEASPTPDATPTPEQPVP